MCEASGVCLACRDASPQSNSKWMANVTTLALSYHGILIAKSFVRWPYIDREYTSCMGCTHVHIPSDRVLPRFLLNLLNWSHRVKLAQLLVCGNRLVCSKRLARACSVLWTKLRTHAAMKALVCATSHLSCWSQRPDTTATLRSPFNYIEKEVLRTLYEGWIPGRNRPRRARSRVCSFLTASHADLYRRSWNDRRRL